VKKIISGVKKIPTEKVLFQVRKNPFLGLKNPFQILLNPEAPKYNFKEPLTTGLRITQI